MKITKRQLKKIIKEEKARVLSESQTAGPPISGAHAIALGGSYGGPDLGNPLKPPAEPHSWAKAMAGDVDRDEEGQTIIYLNKGDHPSARSFLRDLPDEWDYEETHDGSAFVIYTGIYPSGAPVHESYDYNQDYVVHPTEYVKGAMSLLTPEEFNSIGIEKMMREAEVAAGELRNTWPEDEGFGSSDRTYELQSFLEMLGFKTGFPGGTLEVVREGKMKITKRQLKRIIKEEQTKLQERTPAAAGAAAARHEGRPDYRWLAERVDQQARMLEQLLMDAESAMIMNDNKSLVDDFEKIVEDAFQLAVTFDRLGGG